MAQKTGTINKLCKVSRARREKANFGTNLQSSETLDRVLELKKTNRPRRISCGGFTHLCGLQKGQKWLKIRG